jgi:guanosine-3',5'-bis(diphosphate) 3'-pyrophosphohydrolase
MPAQDVELRLSFTNDLPLTRKAVRFGVERHRGQERDSDHAPFVVHPLEVASLLERAGYPDHVVAAAVLHDVLEDTDTDRAGLEADFGREVAQLVAAVSDDPTIEDEEERKSQVRERIRHLDGEAAAIYAADKVSKVRELRVLVVAGASRDEVEVKLRRHRKSLEMLAAIMPGSRLVALLRFELEALEQLPPQAQA